jgi:hypothetical protein
MEHDLCAGNPREHESILYFKNELTFYLRASMKHSGILILTWRYYIPLKHATRQYSKEKWERPLHLGLLNQS